MSKHEELIERLRMLADAVKLSPHTEWQLWTSNSWRRFQGVLEPVTQKDGHPDLHAAPGVLEFIEAASPAAVTDLLDALEAQEREIEGLRKDAERYRAFIDCGQPICFLGEEYFGKEALDAAIDAAKGALHD